MDESGWVCCQLGSREHYAVPRALASIGRLSALVTDVWMPPHLSRHLPRIALFDKLSERFHPALQKASVNRLNGAFIRFEVAHRLRRTGGWARIMARNRLFGKLTIQCLERMNVSNPATIFTYSYAGREVLHWAKARGWRTVLGQIDPGPVEVDIVREETMKEPQYGAHWDEPPPEYWDGWREECNLADTIVVNSQWSYEALREAGISSEKLQTVPLAYEAQNRQVPPKIYPAQFTQNRPLRVLFLGQVNLRKGVARLLQAARTLRGEAVEFWMVGPIQIKHALSATKGDSVRWIGPVPRGKATDCYRSADVFILPTLSDGFAITQLEALAHRLPVIASTSCGQVVRDGTDGRILSSPTVDTIVTALRECLHEPSKLAAWSRSAVIRSEFTLASLARRMAG